MSLRPLVISVLAGILVASCAAESPTSDLAAAPPLAPQDVDGGIGAGGSNGLPPGASCTSHDECASGSCRERCCKTTCNWECPISDSPMCDSNGDCYHLGAHHYYWCGRCGISGGESYFGPCSPETGPLSCPIAPNGTPCGSFPTYYPWQTCQDGWCVDTKLPLGSPCGAPGECLSSICSDGVCCDAWCPGPSKACTVAHGATADGVCTDLTTCDDGDACTDGDVVVNGTCAGSPITCQPADDCHVASGCDPQSGCTFVLAADGTPCSMGSCVGGVCTPPSTGTGGSGVGGATTTSSSTTTSSGTGGATTSSGTGGAMTSTSSVGATGGSGGMSGGSSSAGAGQPQAGGTGSACAIGGAPSSAWPWAALLAMFALRRRRAA